MTYVVNKDVKVEKYPGKQHAVKVAQHVEEANQGLIYVAGGANVLYPYSDQDKPFRQNRNFFYLTGCNIPGCHVVYNIGTRNLTLYLPNVDEEDIMWSGLPVSPSEALKRFDVDIVKFVGELEKDVSSAGDIPIFIIDKENEFSNKLIINLPNTRLGNLEEAFGEARLIKDEFEIQLMKKAAAISDQSHLAVLSNLPVETNEGHIHAEFVYHSMRQGSKNQAYDPICCSGPVCSTLHYTANDKSLKGKQLVLLDAGAEWENYAADVTRTFPINGEWTNEAREIYDLVLKMQHETMIRIKPGTGWEELHLLAHRILIEEFIKLGIFIDPSSKKGQDDDNLAAKCFDLKLSARFFPHGLGHLLGMDTHDVGGKPNYNDPNPLLEYLRLRRSLKSGMIVTVEPGCYFNKFLLDPILNDGIKSKFINTKVLEKYWAVGGVRIEDDVLVTNNGYENLTGITSNADEISTIVKDGIARGPKRLV